MKATSSLHSPLAAKPNDNAILILFQRDSVTFSTAKYRFDINRIAAVTLQHEVISDVTRCVHVRGGLTELSYPMSF